MGRPVEILVTYAETFFSEIFNPLTLTPSILKKKSARKICTKEKSALDSNRSDIIFVY